MSGQHTPREQAVDPSLTSQFLRVQPDVESEFDVEESLLDHGVPTFYVKLRSDSKRAFIRLVGVLAKKGFTPVLRESDDAFVLRVIPRADVKPSRYVVNVVLLLLTIVTVFVTGYFLSLNFAEYGLDPWGGAGGFTLALLGILGVHEMAHKFAADHHHMEASMPYFIPGPPVLFGIGTFGALIVQKENAPNRDALFDMGASGPLAGFIVATIVSAFGLLMSQVEPMTEPLPGGGLPVSPLFLLLIDFLVETPGSNYVVYLHPIAFAGWIGMFVTLLNLLPTGMLDGGHTVRSVISNDTARTAFAFASIVLLLFTEQWLMLAIVLFLSMYRHPGPLDDVSKLSPSRRLVAVVLLVVFGLCLFIF